VDFPADLRWPATSIGGAATVAATRDAVSNALSRWVDAPAEEVLAEFRRRDALVGREVAWEGGGIDPGAGTVAGIDERGNLVIEPESGEPVALGAGEVTLRVSRS
jgi:biotin-(acetyl-CoA carboxylase) ligase